MILHSHKQCMYSSCSKSSATLDTVVFLTSVTLLKVTGSYFRLSSRRALAKGVIFETCFVSQHMAYP